MDEGGRHTKGPDFSVVPVLSAGVPGSYIDGFAHVLAET